MKLQILSFKGLDILWFRDVYPYTSEACFLEYDCRWKRRNLWLFLTLSLEAELFSKNVFLNLSGHSCHGYDHCLEGHR